MLNKISRVKLHKKGKTWIAILVTFLAVGAHQNIVKADSINTQVEDESTTTTDDSTPTKTALSGNVTSSSSKNTEEPTLKAPQTTDNLTSVTKQTAVNTQQKQVQQKKIITSPNVHKVSATDEDIDQWMPDKALQQIVLDNIQDKDIANISDVSQITKAMVGKLEGIDSDAQLQRSDENWYKTVLAVQSLKSLEYATDLAGIDITADGTATSHWTNGKTALAYGKLSDISALKNLDKLETINFQFQNLSDISAPANKPNLKQVSISYNHITDLSPLATSPKIDAFMHDGFQYVLLPSVKLGKNTKKFTTPSFIITNIHGKNVPIDIDDHSDGIMEQFVRNYASTLQGKTSNDGQVITWTITNTSPKNGYMTAYWDDPNLGQPGYEYFGAFIIPYTIVNQDIGQVNVQFKNSDGTTVWPQQTLTGTAGSTYDLKTNVQIKAIIDHIKTQYGYDTVHVQSGTEVGEFDTNNVQTVVYVFNKGPQEISYTITPIDSNGNKIPDAQIISDTGIPGNSITAPNITGWTLEKGQDDKLKVPVSNGNINLVYLKDITETHNVTRTIKYVDDQNQEISPSVTQKVEYQRQVVQDAKGHDISGYGDDSWHLISPSGEFPEIESPIIEGYTADSSKVPSENTEENMQDQTIVVHYHKNTPIPNPTTYVTITVDYVDDEGNKLKPTETTQVVSGSKYNYTAPDINGYQYTSLASSSDPNNGVALTSEHITFEYKAISHDIVPNPTPTPTPTPQPKPNFPTNNGSATSNVNNPSTPSIVTYPSNHRAIANTMRSQRASLPQTSERKATLTSVIGFSLVASAVLLLFGLVTKRRRKIN